MTSTQASQLARLGQPKHGIVTSVDPVRHTVRVMLQPEGIETGDIAAPALAVGTLRMACPLELGSQVTVKPIEGDAEHYVVSTVIYDAIMTPPTSPQTGQVAQPGELLVAAGQGAAPATDGGSVGATTAGAGWFHVTPGGFFAGAGNAKVAVVDGSITMTIGSSTYTFTAASLAAVGGKIVSDQDVLAKTVSLASHEHYNVTKGTDVTGTPVP